MPSAQTDRFVHDHLPPADQWPEMRYDSPELRVPEQFNVVQALFDRAFANGHADRPLFRSDERTLSYAQAQVEVNRIANALTVELGLVPGNRVLLRGGNSVAMALAWLATVQAGLVAVATMPLLRAKELGAILTKSQPSVALCDAQLQDELKTALAGDPGAASTQLLVFNAGDTDAANSLEALARRHGPTSTPCRTAATDIARLIDHADVTLRANALPVGRAGLLGDDVIARFRTIRRAHVHRTVHNIPVFSRHFVAMYGSPTREIFAIE